MRIKSSYSKEWILSIPKIINGNGCWIPSERKPGSEGYIQVQINDLPYLLHRIVMCLYYDINYHDRIIQTRHSNLCVRACFNPEHLKPGTHSDNMQDYSATKTHCKRCGTRYTKSINKTGLRAGKVYFYCGLCANNHNRNKR